MLETSEVFYIGKLSVRIEVLSRFLLKELVLTWILSRQYEIIF